MTTNEPTSVTTRTVTVGPLDTDLAVAEVGRGGRPLLLVHGFTGAKEDFGDWMEALAADGWWVVAPDLRGHGASAKPTAEEDYSFVAFADDLDGLLAELGWDRFALLGHSMGGAIVQELALRDPARIERLVLMNTHHASFEGLDPGVVQTGIDIIRTEGLPALLEVLDAFAGPKKASEQRVHDTRPGYAAFGETKLAAASPAMYASMAMQLVTRADRLDELASFTAPTLVIIGVEDVDLVPASERMGATIPGATLAVIPDAAHAPQFENPDAWWQALRAFLLEDSLVD